MTTTPELLAGLLTPEGQENAYETYAQLRAVGPIVPDVPVGVITTTYDAALEVLRSHQARAVGDFFGIFLPPEERNPVFSEASKRVLIFMNPPDHTRVRVLLQKAFTTHLVNRMEPRLQELLDGFLDDLEAADAPDIMEHVALQFPTSVIATVLGIRIEDRFKFKPIADGVARFISEPPGKELLDEMTPHALALAEFINGYIDEKRADPDDALLSAMIHASEQDDKLSREEIIANVFALLIAGHETTTNLIGNGIRALMTHRDQWERLVDDPSLAARTVEEVVRFDAPFQFVIRIAGEDMEIQGQPVAADTAITVGLGLANQDPAHFDSPAVFDIMREPNDHLGFGEGIHYCIGNALARKEGALAFASMATRFPGMRLDPARPVTRRLSRTLRGLQTLPVLLD